jgi:putative ABC transport system permease protein
MLKNYLKVAVRNVMRHKVLSFINISGLALGMAACLMILQYVGFELSYDTFHTKKDQIYRIRNDKYKNGEVVQRGVVSYPVVAKAMKKDFPEVQNYVRIAPWIADHTILKYGDKVFREKKLLFAEPSLFTIFSFPLIKGNAATALSNPSSIVLSESKAREIFGKEEAMGKIISFEGKKPFLVTGIFKDVPANSHLQFSMLVSYNTLAQWMDGYSDSWTFNEEVYGYLQLAPGTDVAKLQAKLANFSKQHYQGNKVSGLDEVFILQPLPDIHLHSHFQFELGQNGNAAATWGLLGVAILIMVIAWSNYINLATARFTERAKEIGVRKVIGANIKQLLHQFMVESLLISLLSFALAVIVFILLNPFFLQWLGLTLLADFPILFHGQSIWFWATLLFGLGAVMSGLYPVLVLPSYKTVTILKGKVQEPTAAVSFRKVLVVYQFAIAISLIAFTTVAYQQVNYMLRQDLGVNIDGTLVVWGPMGLKWDKGFKSRMLAFENEVKNIPGIKAATNSKNVPGDHLGKEPGVKLKGHTSGHTLAAMWAGSTFFDLYGMPLLAGRTFTAADTGQIGENKVVLNESAIKLLGFRQPTDALGKRLEHYGRETEIVGVVTDHHQQSLHSLVEPIMFQNGVGQDGYFSIKISNKNLPETLAQVEELYRKFFNGASFEYFFLDNYFDQQYRTEHLLIPLIRTFSFFAIFISCLGLWGLVLHAFTRRTKEIGIRKVLGASLHQLVTLLSKDFLKLVLIAFVLATPVAYYVLHYWLQDFAYRIGISWGPFVLAGGTVLFIALLTVSIQAIKAAVANPVKALRSE